MRAVGMCTGCKGYWGPKQSFYAQDLDIRTAPNSEVVHTNLGGTTGCRRLHSVSGQLQRTLDVGVSFRARSVPGCRASSRHVQQCRPAKESVSGPGKQLWRPCLLACTCTSIAAEAIVQSACRTRPRQPGLAYCTHATSEARLPSW